MEFCTYLTLYRGNKLPPFYIGYSSTKRVSNGYHGSVTSKQYKNIWKSELKTNPHLFKTIIISTHETKQKAIDRETEIQQKLNVIKNPLYINQCIWSMRQFIPIKRKHTEKSKQKTSNSLKKYYDNNTPKMLGRKHTEESKRKMGISQQQAWKNPNRSPRSPNSIESRIWRSENLRGDKHARYGKYHSEETKRKISKAKLGKKLNLSKEERWRRSEHAKQRNQPHSEETKRKISKAHCKFIWVIKHPTFGIQHVEDLRGWCTQRFDKVQSALIMFRSRGQYKGYIVLDKISTI